MDKSYINKPPVHVTKMSIVSITGKVLSVEAGQSTFRPEQTTSRIKAAYAGWDYFFVILCQAGHNVMEE